MNCHLYAIIMPAFGPRFNYEFFQPSIVCLSAFKATFTLLYAVEIHPEINKGLIAPPQILPEQSPHPLGIITQPGINRVS